MRHPLQQCRSRLTFSFALPSRPGGFTKEYTSAYITSSTIPTCHLSFLPVVRRDTLLFNCTVRTDYYWAFASRKLSSAAVPTLDSAVNVMSPSKQVESLIIRRPFKRPTLVPAAWHCMSNSQTPSRKTVSATRKHFLHQHKR